MNELRHVLRHFKFTPKKSLGQNFVFDEAVLGRIVSAAEVSNADDVLEIGPGAGSLTRQLAKSAKRVVAVELDPRLMPVLRYTLNGLANVTLIQGDILDQDPASLMPDGYKAVANIPYYITGAIIRHLLESTVKPSLVALTVQREVAERVCAQPPQMSLLAVSVQFYGAPRILGRIPAGAFYPAPDVDSAIVRIDLHRALPLTGGNADSFFAIVKAGFGQKRKKLKNALAAGLKLSNSQIDDWLTAADIDPSRRAEALSLEEWLAIYRAKP